MAVEGAAGGDVAQEEALDAGHADGQGLHVPAQAGQVSADVGLVRADVLPEAPDAGSAILAQAVDSRADFGAKGAEVTTRFVPMHHDQRGANGVYIQPGLRQVLPTGLAPGWWSRS